jgi:hypothetical protein
MRLFVPLTPAEIDALMSLARAERRSPQDQAAVILSGALARLSGPRDTVAGADERCRATRPDAADGNETARGR